MRQALRALLPAVPIALLAMALIDLWIRAEPLEMPRGVQVALSLALLAAVAVLLVLVVREERRGVIGPHPPAPSPNNGRRGDLSNHG